MSDELDLEAKNLCIPEDAFEKFQAVSMYQEEQYITLPENMPRKPKPRASDERCPVTSVNEVVSSSGNITSSPVNITQVESLEEKPLNSSCVESSVGVQAKSNLAKSDSKPHLDSYENDTDMVVSNSENVSGQVNTTPASPTEITTAVPQRRGRRAKKSLVPLEEASAETPKNIQNPDISSTPFSSDPEMDTVLAVRKKRGRPRKVWANETPSITNNSDKDLSSELSSSDNNKTLELAVTKPSRGKRGRPKGSSKKSLPDVNSELQAEALLVENQSKDSSKQDTMIQNDRLSNTSSEKPKRQRRRIESISKLEKTELDDIKVDTNNKILSNKVSDDDLDDVCLSKLKSDRNQSNMGLSTDESSIVDKTHVESLKDLSSETIDGQLQKGKKRRGRPKKSITDMSDNTAKIESVSENVPSKKQTDVENKATGGMSLSNIKETVEEPPTTSVDKMDISTASDQVSEPSTREINGTPTKRNTKMPVMADFVYNIDSVIGNNESNSQDVDDSLLVIDTSKRPIRRKIKTMKYDEGSDEDPFANVELSDDEPRRGRRGNRYYSDDEYVPGKRFNDAVETTDTEMSDSAGVKLDDSKRQRRKKMRKKSDNQSPRKKARKDDDSKASIEPKISTDQTDDVEVCLESSVIKPGDGDSQKSQPAQQWGASTEFENFLAKKIQGTSLKIKKVSTSVPNETSKMEIPVIDPEAKKTIEMCSQTTAVQTTSIGIQTTTPNDIPLIENIPLTPEQSEKACFFLNSIVKTTAELGSLMTQKSQDFIKKKINTSHVVDTAKMDYCVKKSFLLFKLAKHNLLQMEEDLAKQYDEFLRTQNLTRCREEPKAVVPTPKESNSDSDCEIVDVEPSPNIKPSQKPQGKPAFNPKTVFLNKELSIKIAKKPSESKKLDIKGRHTVWINDTVMVKKVKPTQSFLAQDSRNKKPPDNPITIDMVSNFFKDYYRQKALSICGPFVSRDWLNVNQECVCNYFVVKPQEFNPDANYSGHDGFSISSHASNTTVSEPNHNLSDIMTLSKITSVAPESLFTLCFRILNRHMQHDDFKEGTHKKRHDLADRKSIPVTLFRLCIRTINNSTTNEREICPAPAKHESSSNHPEAIQVSASSLKTLCHRQIVKLLEDSTCNKPRGETESYIDINSYSEGSDSCSNNLQEIVLQSDKSRNGFKSLFSLCVEYIQRAQHIVETNNNSILSPKSLKNIAYENVKYLLYANESHEDMHLDDTHSNQEETAIEGLMINCVNTLSEEAFLNLEQCNTDLPDSSEYLNDFDSEHNYDPEVSGVEDDPTEPSWASQVQMQELRSCVNVSNLDTNGQQELEPIITQIKLEPLDDITDGLLDTTQVKIEPGPGPDEMTIIPDVKPEIEDHIQATAIQRRDSHSYDEDAFEQFVTTNKLMHAYTDTEEIYSQSAERVRRQHEPDYYEENAADMLGLLVPHTYENMNIQSAKGSLMESSSDESSKKATNLTKKATAKRGKGRAKKSDKPISKEVSGPPPALTKEKEKVSNNEVAILTRKMKDRIRQEEKNNESTDSEDENITVRLRSREKKEAADAAKDKAIPVSNDQVKTKSKPVTKSPSDQSVDKTKQTQKPAAYQTRDKSKPIVDEPEQCEPSSSSQSKNNEIQCNNVDSTDQLEDNVETFTGFTSIETNEMSNYEKYMKFVYEKVIPDKDECNVNDKRKDVKESKAAKSEISDSDKRDSPVICPNEPVELLECEPTIPIIFGIEANKGPSKRKPGRKIKAAAPDPVPLFIDRHGWQCYPINQEDAKLFQDSCVYLEKLPESFVQTYFQYQNVAASIDESDEEINRLTNLNTLKRATILKDRKPQINLKREPKDDKLENGSANVSPSASAIDSDHYDELVPSEDEGPNIEVELPQPVSRQTENVLAKNSLMDDKESDDEEAIVKIKKEPEEENTNTKKIKSSAKKKAPEPEDPSDLMLTADKMMNKELTLLHAPVVMGEQIKETPAKGPVTRHNKKSASKTSPSSINKVKTEEDSSSEEEKQWVSTKEKLLKRMGKKDSASADDAKRAKLVTEFIERREGNPDSIKRRQGARPRRASKKFLEREKQLRVLQRELFGEMSNDPTVSKRSVAAWKGRRNIRKVLDKKSLARSTVIANMEEFERKKRLNARQTKLRELLGCEEGVNVLVINDEVCLEYDFEEHRPVVTIHPFFTKVMKAHQYEGVKFMWDACFESLADIAAGHAGGGCILAHCMGLGKTLQVLALLHTVLTHPRVGMHRVLVCCPLSTVLNWVDEIHKWIGPVTNQIKVFELSKLRKTYERAYQLEDWYNGGGIFIIGYELFRSLSTLDPLLDDVRPTIVNKIRTALLDPGPDIIVCDEGHLLKNDCSVLAVAMSRVVTKRRIVLTGTPMQNNLREYYCMVNFVKPNLLGTYSEYSNRFENPIMNGQHRDSSEEDIKLMKARTHILHKVLEECLQRQEASVLYPYLPKKHEYTVFINLTKCQWDLYKHYLNHYSKQMKQNSILKDFHILQKIWSHPQVLHNFQTKSQENRNKLKVEKIEDDLATEDQEDIKDNVATELWWLQYLDGGNMLDSVESSNKFVVVFRILDECVALGDKVLIFSTSLFCLDALEYFLKKINKWSLGQEYYRLDGSVPPEVRQKWCREFNAENNVNTKLFLVSTRAGCLGLNMTAANRVIIMDTSWNPAHDIQSIFRVYRFGQKKDCYIYRLVAMGTMEQKIYERSVTKQAVACRVVDEQQIDRHYNMAELTELYRYDEAGSSVAGGVAVGVCDVALLRVARETALHAVHEHDSLLRSSEQGLPEHERAAAWMQFQQEQAHKQMENKLIANIPKLSLKRLQGNDYEKSLHLEDIKPDIKMENMSDDFVTPPETKPKRGRKPKQVVDVQAPKPSTSKDEHSIPKQASVVVKPEVAGPSQNIDPKKFYDEEVMVQKITELLIKHDFQNRKGNTDISTLVTQVRKIVKQGYIFKNDKVDDLTTSIAKVLLQKRVSLPVVTDIMCESINKSASPIDTEEPENILSTPTEERIVKEVPDNRRKRKAALVAEKNIDSISQDVIISLDEDPDPWDSDFVPNIVEKPEKMSNKRKSLLKAATFQQIEKDGTPTPRASNSEQNERKSLPAEEVIDISSLESVPQTKPRAMKPKAGPKTFKEKLQKKYIELTQGLDADAGPKSILISGDEKVGNRRTPATRSVEVASPVVSVDDADDDDELVPLPLSLLTNKNFINIVAHTYLSGNPMLDADAATLAAQYSTFRSLKEAEQTGHDITSGPIYDIALKVIGKTLFKRMNSNNVKTNTSQVEAANVTIELKEKMDRATEKKQKEETKPKKRKEKKTYASKNMDRNVIESITIDGPSGNVVPVGLIKTTASNPSAEFAVESILPDDDNDDNDDLHIVPHDLPACPPLQHAPTPAKPPGLNHSQPAPTLSSTQTPKKLFKITRGKTILPTTVVSGNSTQAKPTPLPPLTPQHILPNNDTICLDSDEEDTITSSPAPPVPVSLSVGPSSDAILPTPLTAMPLTSMSGLPQRSLILRQVAAGSAPRFVLVPAAGNTVNMPVTGEYLTKVPRLPPKEQSTPSTQPNTISIPALPAESILSTSTLSSANVSKVKKARCKPGDIIKISDNGEIEVLKVAQLNAITQQSLIEPQSKAKVEARKSSPVQVIEDQVINIEQDTTAKPTITNDAKLKSNTTDLPKAKSAVQPAIVKAHSATVSKSSPAAVPKPPSAKVSIPSSAAVSKPCPTAVPKSSSLKPFSSSVLKPSANSVLKQSPAATTIPSNNDIVIIDSHSPTNTHITQTKVAKPAESCTKSRRVSISSSSSEDSRPISPDNNPLSILKHVVHIQAEDEAGTSTDKTKAKKNKTSYIKHVHTTDAKSSSVGVPPKEVTKDTVMKPIMDITKLTNDIAKPTKDQTISNISNTSSVNDSVKKEATNKILTELLNKKTSLSLKKPIFDKMRSVKPKTQEKGASVAVKAKVVDNKSISSGSKSFKTVDLTQIATTVKSGSAATMLKTKIQLKKRAASMPPSTAKKKKTEPMTLKDFNIDDFDDIIELE